jgi:twitching motility protein PilT
VALFQFGKKDPVARLREGDWTSSEERAQLINDALGPAGTRKVDDVVALLFNDDQTVRRAAANRLRTVITVEAVDSFVKLSRNKSPQQLTSVARAIVSHLPPVQAVERAKRHLGNRDLAQKRAAEVFLMCCPLDGQLLDLASRWLEPDGDVARALAVMENIERTARDRELGKTGHALVRKAVEHPDEKVRHISWKLLTAEPDASMLPLYVEHIGRETYHNQQLISQAIIACAQDAHVDLTDTILPLLGSSSVVLRTTAVKLLGRLDNVEEIVRKFATFSRNLAPMVRDRAFETLRDLGERIIPVLIELMDETDTELRMLAITMASALGTDSRMVGPLTRALDAEDWWVRSTAVETLGQIADPRTIGPLTRQMSDPDTVWTAIGALANIGNKLLEQGDRKTAGAAFVPLLAMLKRGQADVQGEDSDAEENIRVEIIHVLTHTPSRHMMEVLKRVATNDRSARVQAEAVDAAASMARKMGELFGDEARLRQSVRETAARTAMSMGELDKMLGAARLNRASDLHVAADQPVMIRVGGVLRALGGYEESLDADRVARLIREILSDPQAAEVARTGQVSFCHTVTGSGRFRAGVFSDYHGVNAVFRVIPTALPTIQSIGMPPHFADVQHWHQGLLVVCGASGSGKTTTLAALINLINESRESHILTVEDPIEYVHQSRRSLINQRELNKHTESYARALRGALRQDPDVIVIGELDANETISLAMEASETGHLVIGTLNCTRADAAVDRIVGSYPPDEQNQVRLALSESLQAVVAQTLVAGVDSERAAVFEVLMATPTVRNLIRENKVLMLESAMQTGRVHGMQTYDDALLDLVRDGKVGPEEAFLRARSKKAFEDMASDVEEAEQ